MSDVGQPASPRERRLAAQARTVLARLAQKPVSVIATSTSDKVEVTATVMPATPSSMPLLRRSPITLRERDNRQMKNRLIGNSRPLTTCTPTSSEMTGTPGTIATKCS